MNILLFSGSFRTESFNRKMVFNAEQILASLGHKTEVVDVRALGIPVYDGDIEAAGIPAGVKTLGEKISKADAIFISTPEYNHSMASSYKNTIDWVSRIRPMPFTKKPVGLSGASPGGFGAIRGIVDSQAPLLAQKAYVYNDLFALPKAAEAFDTQGNLKDPKTKEKFGDFLKGFVEFSKKFTS